MSSTPSQSLPQLPDESVLSVDEYVAMLRALGETERYELLSLLIQRGELTVDEMAEALDETPERVEGHVAELESVGLVNHRLRRNPDRDDLYSYYVATSLGEAIISRGVGELIREEWQTFLSAMNTTDELTDVRSRFDTHDARLDAQDRRIAAVEDHLDRNLYQPVALGAGSMTAVVGVVHAAAGSVAAAPILLLSLMFWVGLWLLRQ